MAWTAYLNHCYLPEKDHTKTEPKPDLWIWWSSLHSRPQESTTVSTFFYLLSIFYGANRPSVFSAIFMDKQQMTNQLKYLRMFSQFNVDNRIPNRKRWNSQYLCEY